ncbi:MAG: hypothetical protein O2897_03145 [bacterium]|nr:hypothetical protein [bacterium]
MVSPTKQTWNIRDNKKIKQGKKRKQALVNHGSTKTREELFKVVQKASS